MKKFTATYKVGSSEIVLGKFKTEALAWNALDEYCDKLLLDIEDEKSLTSRKTLMIIVLWSLNTGLIRGSYDLSGYN